MKMKNLTAAMFWEKAWEYAGQEDDRTFSDQKEETFWKKYSPTYDETNPLAPYTDELIATILRFVQQQDTFLEIGPGTGGFTKLLAPHVNGCTIVEPSKAMLEQFRKNWDGDFPRVIQKKWEEAEACEADIIFGANAFYRMKDMRTALLKMNECARRFVFIVQSIGRPFAGPLQAMIDDEFVEVERAIAITNILQELEIKHVYETYQVTRKCGRTHDVALIYWSK